MLFFNFPCDHNIFVLLFLSVWKLDAWCQLQKCMSLQSNSNWTVSRIYWKQDVLNLLCTYWKRRELFSALWLKSIKQNKKQISSVRCTNELHFQKIGFKCWKEPMNSFWVLALVTKWGTTQGVQKYFDLVAVLILCEGTHVSSNHTALLLLFFRCHAITGKCFCKNGFTGTHCNHQISKSAFYCCNFLFIYDNLVTQCGNILSTGQVDFETFFSALLLSTLKWNHKCWMWMGPYWKAVNNLQVFQEWYFNC